MIYLVVRRTIFYESVGKNYCQIISCIYTEDKLIISDGEIRGQFYRLSSISRVYTARLKNISDELIV